MALDVVQVEGCYVSSSLPKALYVPARSKYAKNQRNYPHIKDGLYLKPERKTKQLRTEISNASDSALPVAGRQHLSVQTDLYLEELCDVVGVADVECETDPLLDRPPSPLFIPAKSGPDKETQIYPGELFDFDVEVEPLLESLVGQTLEQALIEIMAEEELAVINDMHDDYEARKNADLAELKRLEERERRIFEERKARLKEQEEAIKLEDEVAQKIAACVFAQNYLSQLVPEVYKKLETQGYFETEDPDIKEIEEEFWPWLLSEVDNEIATLEASYKLLDSLIDDAVQNVRDTSVINPAPLNDYAEHLAEKQDAPDVLPEEELEIDEGEKSE